eukprot:gene2130-27931_t
MKLVVVLGIFFVLLLEVDGGFFKDKAPTVPPPPPAPPKTAAEECLLLKPASQQCSCEKKKEHAEDGVIEGSVVPTEEQDDANPLANNTDQCVFRCGDGTAVDCINGTTHGGICEDACPLPVFEHVSAAGGQCDSIKPCGSCSPRCANGYSYIGEPSMCGADGKWSIKGECKWYGVHRVGVGVYLLNVADINLQAGSFYVDFVLTMFTETWSFPTYAEALRSFGSTAEEQRTRECSPDVTFAKSSRTVSLVKALRPRSRIPLGSKLNGLGEEVFPGNGYRAVSPSQFLSGDRAVKDTPPSAEKLALTFATMEKGVSITPMQVQGKAFFKPDLRRWPFDTQQLEIMIEDLEQTLHTNISFLMCHMVPSPLQQHAQDLGASEAGDDCAGGDTCPAQVIDTCDRNFEPFRTDDPDKRNESLTSFSCYCRGGRFSSSRYIASIEFKAPETQRFIKSYLPAVMISFINSMSYVMDFKDYSQRITICVGTLTALVLFHVSLTNQLPSSPQNTLADFLMINCYAPEQIALFFRWLGPLLATSVTVAATREREIWFEQAETRWATMKLTTIFLVCPMLAAVLRWAEVKASKF